MSPNGFTEDLSTIDENESDKQVDEELSALRSANKGIFKIFKIKLILRIYVSLFGVDFTSEVSLLQVELNAAKLEEFEAQEKLIEVAVKVEEEAENRRKIEAQVRELQARCANLEQLLGAETSEHKELKEKFEQEKKLMSETKKAADKVLLFTRARDVDEIATVFFSFKRRERREMFWRIKVLC